MKGNIIENSCFHQTKEYDLTWDDGPSNPYLFDQTLTKIYKFTETVGKFDFSGQAKKEVDRILEMSADDFEIWNWLFWWGGVRHDNCYHHNPITYGYDRKYCDQNFLGDLNGICSSVYKETKIYEESKYKRIYDEMFDFEFTTTNSGAIYFDPAVLPELEAEIKAVNRQNICESVANVYFWSVKVLGVGPWTKSNTWVGYNLSLFSCFGGKNSEDSTIVLF